MDEDTDADFLRDLASRLWQVPVKYNVDQCDAERLARIARTLKEAESL